ncbi:MAG TPA: DnaJ domain-containing protein [Stellaceae bacterium]|nr:DnaJ domain-containing protein [Stellaceae bacterium]
MPFLIGGILILLVLVMAGRAFVNADPKKLGRFVSWFLISLAVLGATALVLLLLVSERLGPALALVGFMAPVLMRTKSIWRRWLSTAGPSVGNVSEVETSFLRMRLDHDTGAMSGTVRHGRFAGRRLDELAEPELYEFWRDCRVGDEASARLMESYLDRLRPDWRGAAAAGGGDGAGPRTTADAMTREEALAVLGLAAGADAAAIKKAHRELMMKLHPDQGGSTYLAAKINRAKEILLG